MTANVKISQILIKRGNTTAASSYTGPLGELIVDTGLQTLRIQDGITPGGYALATTGQLANTIAVIEGINNGITANVDAILANIQGVDLSSINSNIAAANVAIGVLQSGNLLTATSLTVPSTISSDGLLLNADLGEGYAFLTLPNNLNASSTQIGRAHV